MRPLFLVGVVGRAMKDGKKGVDQKHETHTHTTKKTWSCITVPMPLFYFFWSDGCMAQQSSLSGVALLSAVVYTTWWPHFRSCIREQQTSTGQSGEKEEQKPTAGFDKGYKILFFSPDLRGKILNSCVVCRLFFAQLGIPGGIPLHQEVFLVFSVSLGWRTSASAFKNGLSVCLCVQTRTTKHHGSLIMGMWWLSTNQKKANQNKIKQTQNQITSSQSMNQINHPQPLWAPLNPWWDSLQLTPCGFCLAHVPKQNHEMWICIEKICLNI